MRLRLCSFNIENLFTRFDFRGFDDDRAARYLPAIVKFYGDYGDGDFSKFDEFKSFLQSAAVSQDDDKRQHTALAIAKADADIYCLQEVDSASALTRFWDAYVKKIGVDKYDQFVLHEGNDRRGIDVAAIARDRTPILSRSHATVTTGWVKKTDNGKALLNEFELAKNQSKKLKGSNSRIFRRDCQELEVSVGANKVSLFNCHFKSMSGGRPDSMGMRQLEAIAVREIIQRKFENPATALWAIMGDLNDYRMRIKVSSVLKDGAYAETVQHEEDQSGIDPLVKDGFGVNMLEQIEETDRWTQYYSGERSKTQLDYIIASPALAEKLKGKPEIIRSGLPIRVPNLEEYPRYPRIGWDRPKASDHCPVVVEFNI